MLMMMIQVMAMKIWMMMIHDEDSIENKDDDSVEDDNEVLLMINTLKKMKKPIEIVTITCDENYKANDDYIDDDEYDNDDEIDDQNGEKDNKKG